jgi:hypothetical protein
MGQTSIEKEKIHIDFTSETIPENARNFMPEVFKDGDRFICVLGDSVSGEGSSAEEALADWEHNYKAKQANK